MKRRNPYPVGNIMQSNLHSFGMLMKERTFSSETYRYGFGGHEKVDEVSGEGNAVDFGARIYDGRLGRWMSVDPLQKKHCSFSPYNFCINNPILYVDPDGKENIVYIVNVPEKGGKLTITNEKLTAQIADLNKYAVDNNMNVKYILFSDKKGPGPVYTSEPINKENLDKSDGIILVGNPEDVKKYDRDNSLSNKPIMNSSGNSGYTGGESNPEQTDPISNVGYVDNLAIEKSSAPDLYRKDIFLHSLGHMPNDIGINDHMDMPNDQANIMNSGDAANRAAIKLVNQKVDRNTWTKYCTEALKPSNNTSFFATIKKAFEKGTPTDNYQKNKSKNKEKSPFAIGR